MGSSFCWEKLAGLAIQISFGSCGRNLLPSLFPFLNLFVSFFDGDAVALLNLARQAFNTSFDDFQIIVGQFAPFFLNASYYLVPVAFDTIAVHVMISCNK